MGEQEREIAYETEGALTVCPCCGEKIPGGVVYACWRCFGLVGKDENGIALISAEVASGRRMMHDLGVRLRAEGKMPPLKAKLEQKWGVWCIGPACWFQRGTADMTFDTREAASRNCWGGIGYQVRPYDTPCKMVCVDCCREVCDCNDPKAQWGYWHLNDVTGTTDWLPCANRKDALEFLAIKTRSFPDRRRGPVQRKSDPPWKFEDATKNGPLMLSDIVAGRGCLLCHPLQCKCGDIANPHALARAAHAAREDMLAECTMRGAEILADIEQREHDAHKAKMLRDGGYGNKTTFHGYPSLPIDVAALARALHATDLHVKEFVQRKGDGIDAEAVWLAGKKGSLPEAQWMAEAVLRASQVAEWMAKPGDGK